MDAAASAIEHASVVRQPGHTPTRVEMTIGVSTRTGVILRDGPRRAVGRAMLCNGFRGRRRESGANGRSTKKPTPIFRGRPRWARTTRSFADLCARFRSAGRSAGAIARAAKPPDADTSGLSTPAASPRHVSQDRSVEDRRVTLTRAHDVSVVVPSSQLVDGRLAVPYNGKSPYRKKAGTCRPSR
jgi:hypothetical protein